MNRKRVRKGVENRKNCRKKWTKKQSLPNPTGKYRLFILVGGKSSRFGKDKTQLTYRFLYRKFRHFRPIFVAKKCKFKGYPFFVETTQQFAPIFPIIELLKCYSQILVLNGDTPKISSYTLRQLIYHRRVATQNPLVGVYLKRRDLERLKRRALTTLRLTGIAPTYSVNPKELLNINRPFQWEEFLTTPTYPKYLSNFF